MPAGTPIIQTLRCLLIFFIVIVVAVIVCCCHCNLSQLDVALFWRVGGLPIALLPHYPAYCLKIGTQIIGWKMRRENMK